MIEYDGTIVLESETVEECFDEFMNLYHNSDELVEVMAFDALSCTQAPYLSVYQQTLLFGKIMYEIEDDYLRRGNVDEDWEEDMY